MSLTGFTQITTAQINQTYSTSNNVAMGTLGADRRGDIWAWTQNGAVALATGKAVISPAKVSNDTNRSLDSTSNVAVGSLKVTVSCGGAVTADQYAGGFMAVIDGTGKGTIYQISGNSVDYTGGAAHAVDVFIHEGLFAALSTSDTKVALMTNQWSNVVVAVGDASTYVCAGVPQTAVAASYYFWAKVRGLASVLSDGVIAKNTGAILSPSVAGALVTEGTSAVVKRVGFAPEATVDAKYYGVYMTLV